MLLALLTAAFAAPDDGRSLLVLPGAFYSQETSLGLAAFGSSTFPVDGTGSETWPSTFDAAVVYTLEKQASLAVWPTFYLGRRNDLVLGGSYIVSHYPTRFYGVGGDSDDVFVDVTRRWVHTRSSARRRVVGDLYLGATHQLSVVEWQGLDDQDGVVHAAGPNVRWDSRDNALSTRKGLYADLELLPTLPGTDFGFTSVDLDLRGFVPFFDDATFGVQWTTSLRAGEVPLSHLAELGGDEVLRGMFQGRYRDRSRTVLQGEVRIPVVWRLRAVGFGGVGQVFDRPADIDSTPAKWTAGGGLRVELDAEAHSTLRMDVGGGPDGAGFILNFGEAF